MSSEPVTSAASSRLDHYRLEKRLALGGMAEIYLGTDERDGRPVAIKKILPQIATDRAFLDRFFHEISIQIALKHRNIVELLACSPDPRNAYIVMEFIDGGALHTLREQVGKLPWEVALFVAEESLRGLGAAHKKGIVHRDVKPHNIMWKRDGTVKIADFGISQADHLTRLTVTGMVVGTPAHMSPEQARGETLDPRSDLFSIGTVLYELLTGVNPFLAESVTSTLRRVVDVEPDPPSLLDPTIPPSVDVALRKLHAKSRDLRYSTAEEAAEAIRGVLWKEGIPEPATIFRDFLRNPKDFVAARRAKMATESAERAEKLLNDRSAPPEEALWEAYRTLSCAPESQTAQNLFQAAATRAGQRDRPIDNARIRELEAQLRKDPENVGLLLQLAKLYRLERDFVNVMRFFRRLQTVAPADPYTQGQIAALVGGNSPVPRAAPPEARHESSAVPGSREQRPPAPAAPAAEPAHGGSRIAAVALIGVLVIVCVWWASRPKVEFTGTEADRARAQAMINMLKKATEVREKGPPRIVVPENGGIQKVLERGALLEKEGGAAKALAYYRGELAGLPRSGDRSVLLLTIAETADRAGDRDGASRALDDVIALGGPAAAEASFRKGALLEGAHDEAAAQRIYEDLMRDEDAAVQVRATLRFAALVEGSGDTARALSLYEQILARAPDSAEAQESRLRAGGLYAAAGRRADARHAFEEVKRSATPGSELDKSADQGLRALQ